MWTIIWETFFDVVVAMKSGVPFSLIKCQGDWVSNAFEWHLETTLHDHLIGVAMTARAIKSICNSKS